ncbi:class I SAM-dependent methyltransferase [Streptomyces albireticuli]|uniref:class I SAM-dependent methyltransferase n=1 Tax=Streptomyces albireticuli TaxID=1940 RepID=UPI0036931384
MDAYERSMRAMPVREHVEAHSFLRLLGTVSGEPVLDMGCGTGLYARRLKAMGAARVVGADASAVMVARARSYEERAGQGIRYVQWDVAAQAPDAVGLAGAFSTVTAVYLLPYASSWEGLLGMCRAARLALRPGGGRFVTAVLNPDVATDPQWYGAYGMSISIADTGRDGSPGHLTAQVGPDVVEVDFSYWSREAHERALRAAGFATVRWSRPTVSEAGRRRFGDAYWRRYLDRPHTLILEARAEASDSVLRSPAP